MATLQKFKMLATQCGVAPSPTRSPRTSPLVHLPRKKTTLRMLLTRNSSCSRSAREITLPAPKEIVVEEKQKDRSRDLIVQSRNKLKDLFVSSFSEEEENVDDKHKTRDKAEILDRMKKLQGSGGGGEPGFCRPVWVGFRHRLLLKKAWRPMLVTIPE